MWEMLKKMTKWVGKSRTRMQRTGSKAWNPLLLWISWAQQKFNVREQATRTGENWEGGLAIVTPNATKTSFLDDNEKAKNRVKRVEMRESYKKILLCNSERKKRRKKWGRQEQYKRSYTSITYIYSLQQVFLERFLNWKRWREREREEKDNSSTRLWFMIPQSKGISKIKIKKIEMGTTSSTTNPLSFLFSTI